MCVFVRVAAARARSEECFRSACVRVSVHADMMRMCVYDVHVRDLYVRNERNRAMAVELGFSTVRMRLEQGTPPGRL